MGLRGKSHEDKLDEELRERFGEKDSGSGKKSGKDKSRGKNKKIETPRSNYPRPVYQSPWAPRIKLFIMFMILWIIVFALAFLIGAYFGIATGSWTFIIVIAAILVLFNVLVYYLSDRMVLHSYNARIIGEKDNPRLYNIVKEVAMRAELPMPRVAIIPTSNPNAFATGRNPERAVVAATEGILDLLDDDELEGVMAHEMAHVKNRDILVMTVASSAAIVIAFMARMVFFQMFFGRNRDVNPLLLIGAAITAWIAVMMIQFAISRSREYKADRIGAIFIQNPLALADALEKLEIGNKHRPIQRGDPTTSSLFIVNPFRRGVVASLFTTHPPIKERIKRLRKMHEQYSYL